MKITLYLIPVLTLAVFLLIRARIFEKKQQVYIFKPIATLLVITVALLSFLEPAQNVTYVVGVLVGLVLSLGGDIALMFQENRKAFTLGLGFFLLAHVAYTVVFTILGHFSAWDVVSLMVLLAAGLSFYTLIKPNLGRLQVPVIIYIIVISVMVNRAVSTLINPFSFNTGQAVMITMGAVLFYISDVILAANRFWKAWKYHHISLVFYYIGQLLIALAASYFG